MIAAKISLIFFLVFVSAQLQCEARDEAPFPKPQNIKGLQVQMVDDALSLGIHHAALNVSFSLLQASENEPAGNVLSFQNQGRDYYFRKDYLHHLAAQIKPLSDAEVVIYLILLAYPSQDTQKNERLLHPQARADKKYNIAAFNTVTQVGRDSYSATVAFLASRYSGGNVDAGRVWGYIIGNEVNSQWMWYNMGRMPLSEAVSTYHEAVRLAHDAVREHSAYARVYLSFDHHWNVAMPGISDQEAYATRPFLDAFARLSREKGDFEWHVAQHPYPDDLGNPRTWEDKQAWFSEDSPHITFKNLGVASRYMQKQELLWNGKPRSIILSEQGIHCLSTVDGEELQAAGFVYAWENAVRHSGIDAMIWHRHVDHAHEGGLRLGLWENKPGSIADPLRPRKIYDLFKKAGTPAWPEAAEFALPIIGLKSWNELKENSGRK